MSNAVLFKVVNIFTLPLLSEMTWMVFSSPESLLFVIHLSICPSNRLETLYIFIIFSRTTGQISTKLGTKHFRIKRIQVYSNKGPRSFPWGDNYELAKLYIDYILTKFAGPNSTKLGTKHPWVKGFSKGINPNKKIL